MSLVFQHVRWFCSLALAAGGTTARRRQRHGSVVRIKTAVHAVFRVQRTLEKHFEGLPQQNGQCEQSVLHNFARGIV